MVRESSASAESELSLGRLFPGDTLHPMGLGDGRVGDVAVDQVEPLDDFRLRAGGPPPSPFGDFEDGGKGDIGEGKGPASTCPPDATPCTPAAGEFQWCADEVVGRRAGRL